MKKIITTIAVICFLTSCVSSQSLKSLPTDSLNIAIRQLQSQYTDLQSKVSLIQKQIGDLSKVHSITFDPLSFTVQNADSLNQSVFLKPFAVNTTTIDSIVKMRVAALKATSISTTTTTTTVK